MSLRVLKVKSHKILIRFARKLSVFVIYMRKELSFFLKYPAFYIKFPAIKSGAERCLEEKVSRKSVDNKVHKLSRFSF